MDIRSATKKKKGTEPKTEVTPSTNKDLITSTDDSNELPTIDELGEEAVISEYVEFLKKHGITKSDIFQVLDGLITNGNVEWTFNLFDKIPVGLKVRESWLTEVITQYMDKYMHDNDTMSLVTYNTILSQCNLAASITIYKDKRFNIKDEYDFTEVLKEIKKLSFPIMSSLVEKLAAFDRLVAVATSDWAVRNFTKPQQVEQKQNS